MTERRKNTRIGFDRGIKVHIMAIDGTWRRSCIMEDISHTGVLLTVEGSIEKLPLQEFFLVLSSTGLAFRRCALARINGNQIGAQFLDKGTKAAVSQRRAADAQTTS